MIGGLTHRGAMVTVNATTGQTTSILFQFNPSSLVRSLRPRQTGGDGDRASAVQFVGAPVETIRVDIELDAADQVQGVGMPTGGMGIAPQLAALELLVYPTVAEVKRYQTQLSRGVMEVGPYVAPLTLFVWGPSRVIPVSITSLTVTEEAFDPALNPMRARVELELRALSYSDLASSSRGYNLFVAYQQAKEQLASIGVVGDAKTIRNATGADVP